MPDGIGATVLDDLPDDILVRKILILLPPKDVGRCRVVRKAWRGATSTPEFVHEHRRRQPSLPIIDGKGRPSSFVVLRSAVAAGAPSERLWPFLSQCRKPCCEIRLHAACDGFLVVSLGVRYYICNPTIHTHALIPFDEGSINIYDICVDCVHGFYQHQSTGEYRVLWSRVQGEKKEVTLYIFTLGDNESRSIQVILPTTSSPSPHQTYSLIRQISCSSPTHHGGNLHWLSSMTRYISATVGDIIVFDTEAESFRWMSSPVQRRFPKSLFDMEGTLSFFSDSSPGTTSRDVWVMQDYNAQIWAFKYRIDKSRTEASLPAGSAVRGFAEMVVLNEHELLIGFNERHVLRCDTDGAFSQMVSIGNNQHHMKLTGLRIQESVMPIPCSEVQEEEEEFPFSTVHV